jgi:predicted ribonuclease YlaK
MSKTVFLDTNIYLHYQPFDQINWLNTLKASEVTIIIPPITICELNKHKELHPRLWVKKRAALVIKKLSSLFESESRTQIRDGVEMFLEDRDPAVDFDKWGLKHDIQDDNLMASIIASKDENPESKVVLVTSDAGLALMGKARRPRHI